MKLPGGGIARLAALVAHTLLGATIALIVPAGGLTDSRSGQAVVCWWHATLLKILGLRLHVLGTPAPAPALIVANHVSWIDIAAIGAVTPGRFVAKAEIRDWPLIGWLAARAGTLYIRRGDRRASAAVADQITQAFLRDQSVILFPEGTSTDGRDVHPFHARLLTPAIEAGCPVQPVALRYPGEDAGIHPAAPFINDDTLLAHLWRLLRARGEVHVELCFFAAEASAHMDARDLAERTRAVIRHHITETVA
ncbi:MAG: lysophospholipid acyltransferase family protein [Gammaproteobacteria bacterium]|nr:lysophospholipid acyltransferase family protein [Gammaproteobacteria bacterium]